jgi:hypothetical protein
MLSSTSSAGRTQSFPQQGQAISMTDAEFEYFSFSGKMIAEKAVSARKVCK